MDLENIGYAHGKLRKGLLAEVQSTMVSKHIVRERPSFSHLGTSCYLVEFQKPIFQGESSVQREMVFIEGGETG